MADRTYNADEVRRIFEIAANHPPAERPVSAESSGLTLAEIQDIGREVGLEPAVVARAAATLDARPMRRTLGQPIEVGRVVHLSRPLTDPEWDRLVAELRSTFRARGVVTVQGGIREWRNGNLHATLEPTEHGYRLRLGTFKGDAKGFNALGVTGLASGALVSSALWSSGEPVTAILSAAIFSAAGVGAVVGNLVRLPRWAREREKQMEHIAARVTAMIHRTDAEAE